MSVGWSIKSLGELCEVLDSRRKPITKRDRQPGEYPYYGATGILDYVQEFIFDEPLVLIGEDGAKWESGAETAFSANGKYWVNNHAHVVRPLRDRLTDEWLIYHFRHLDLSPWVSGLTVPKLNQGNLREIPIPLPPLPEQRRIVAILDEAFEAIGIAKNYADNNIINIRALLDRFLEDVYLESAARGWPMRQLGSVFQIGSSKRIHERDWSASGVPFYGGKEIVKLAKFGQVVSNAYISEEKYSDYASKYDMPKEGDILITARGTIGVGYVVQDADKFYYKDGNIISMRAKEQMNSHFILNAFRSNAFASQLEELTGSTVTHLPLEKARKLEIRVPAIDVQNAIIDRTTLFEEEIRQLKSVYRRKLSALDELKKSLLHQAFTGALTAKSTDLQVAEVA